MIDYLSIAVYGFPMRMLKSLPVDKILLPRYEKRPINFKDLSFNVNKTSFPLSQISSKLYYCISKSYHSKHEYVSFQT